MTRLLTIEEVAEMLNLKRCTIYKYTSNKEIPFIKFGNRVMFDSEDLQHWINGKKR